MNHNVGHSWHQLDLLIEPSNSLNYCNHGSDPKIFQRRLDLMPFFITKIMIKTFSSFRKNVPELWDSNFEFRSIRKWYFENIPLLIKVLMRHKLWLISYQTLLMRAFYQKKFVHDNLIFYFVFPYFLLSNLEKFLKKKIENQCGK